MRLRKRKYASVRAEEAGKTNGAGDKMTGILIATKGVVLVALVLFGIIFIGLIRALIRGRREDNQIDFSPVEPEAPERRAGRRGEEMVADLIRTVLREEDRLFTNVEVFFDGKTTELDNVIVNKYGAFIIEVKNYNGTLLGGEDDFEWKKYHTTDAGNTYAKTVKNPIRQVKRQIYILAHYLDWCGIQVWVSGYALLLWANSPVESEYILKSAEEIDRAIHKPGKNRLDRKTVEEIAELLS